MEVEGLLAGGALAGAVVMKVIDWFLGSRKSAAETNVNLDLLNQQREALRTLSERVQAMADEQAELRTRLEMEIKLRQDTQEGAHKLRMRVQTLESEMRRLGVVIPPEDP